VEGAKIQIEEARGNPAWVAKKIRGKKNFRKEKKLSEGGEEKGRRANYETEMRTRRNPP